MTGVKQKINHSRSRGWQAFNLLVALTLVLAALGAAVPTSVMADQDEPKVDPNLLQLAEEHPDFTFPVIVQKELKNKDLPDDDPETVVEKANGKVNREKKMDFIASFSADLTGKEIRKLANNPKVRWVSLDAPLFSAATGDGFVMDDFSSKSYYGNAGTVSWSSNWTEVGDNGGSDPTRGRFTTVSSTKCFYGNCLRVDPEFSFTDVSIFRQVDLDGAALAVLSIYRRNELNAYFLGYPGTREEVNLQISADNGESWTTLRTYSSTQNTGADVDTFNIAAYATSTTLIRFAIANQQYGSRYLFIDSVMVTYATASDYRNTVRANEVPMTGAGVTVAVVDSGINPHFDLQTLDGNSSLIANTSLLSGTTPADGYGHGSHVAGIIGGKGNLNPERRGVAPDANLINVKVSDDNGMCLGSDLVAGLQWVYDNRNTFNIKVVNISMNSSVAESYQTSPIDAAVEVLWFNGIVVVVSAGNSGAGAVFPPANDPFVITVGATDEMGTPLLLDDAVTSFSAYGTTEDGFVKPDLVAPGRNILSLLASTNASAYANHPANQFNNDYFRMSGTSMSAPVVSGAVALLLQDEPNLNPDQVKYRLMATANKQWNGYNLTTAGAGYLDVFAAVNGTTTESANMGILASQLLSTGSDPINWNSVGWNSVGWNSVGWNSVGWNSVGWNSVGWNSVGWNSVGWNTVAWNSDYWEP